MRARRAMTLTEIVIVIAIALVLVALLLPAIGVVRERAARAEARALVQQVYRISRVGAIAGPLLGYEVLTAFFLEATFLGVMLFGMNRVPAWAHIAATALVAVIPGPAPPASPSGLGAGGAPPAS